MLAVLLPLAALQGVIMTTCGATNDDKVGITATCGAASNDKVGIMTILGFQWFISSVISRYVWLINTYRSCFAGIGVIVGYPCDGEATLEDMGTVYSTRTQPLQSINHKSVYVGAVMMNYRA